MAIKLDATPALVKTNGCTVQPVAVGQLSLADNKIDQYNRQCSIFMVDGTLVTPPYVLSLAISNRDFAGLKKNIYEKYLSGIM